MAREDSSQASKGGGAVVTRRQDDPVDFPQSSGCSPAIQNVFEFDDLSLYQVPPIAKIYHPSDLINQLLLDKDLSCDIAVTHDDMWVAIVGHLPSDQDGQNDVAEAIKHECSKYTVMSYSGAAYFSPCNMPDTRTGLPDRGHFVHYDGSVPADISYLLAGTVGSLQKENSQASKHNNCPPRMCSYDQGGNECGQLITCGTVPEHFSTVHIKNFAHNIRIACMWRGCGHIVARKNFVRHIREAHLGHERTAGRRYQIPDSVGTSANRPSSLAENPALPMTQPAPSLAQPSLDPHTDEFMIETSVTSMTEMPAEMYMLDSWGEDDVVISQNKHMQMTCSPPAPGATNVGSLIFGSCGRDVAHDENMGAV
ncbi:hypothetical protein EDC04DRAFT_2058537 [Pisolithus marmoratus]|nr:hypothetical protein EDC04DRAFT_2058537 [Pisolithus marmoratus]